MPDTIYLSEKYKPAQLPEVYAPRRALLADMYSAAEDGFIYVAAPAGSGKTVTALLWLLDCKRTPIWTSLDEYDNALSVFYKLIAAGLCSVQPDNENMSDILNDLAFSASPVEHTISIISEMRTDTGGFGSEARRVLILDDMHAITNPEIIKSLPFVIRRLPQTFVTIMLSRTQIPESLEVLVKNKRQIITEQHLRFTQNEISEYFKMRGIKLTSDESGIAHAATNGWAIGINAIAQSGDFSARQGSEVFSGFIEDYVWNAWDESLKDFCLSTCVADELDTELARRLSGRSDAEEMLENLSRTNTFISRTGDDTYRYHHLFLDFLREKTGKTAGLCKTAANYYMENKNYSMALRFWLDSGDYKNADKFLLHFMFHNHHGDIAGYVDFLRMYFIRDFPEKAFRDFPALHVCCAWYYYMAGQYEQYAYHADEGYRHIARIALYDPKFVEFAMLMYSVDHRSEMIDKIKQLGILGKLIKSFSKDGIIRYIASATHNLPYAHRSSFDYTDILSTSANVAKLRKSAFMTLMGDQGDVVISIGISGVLYERNELSAAYDEINGVCKQMSGQNSVELQMSAKFLRHSILDRMERTDEAEEALRDMTAFVHSKAQYFSANLEAYKTKLALIDCDRAAAQAWLSKYYVVPAEYIELYLVFLHFTTARAYMVLGDGKNARRYLTMLRDFGRSLNRVCDFCEASALLAGLCWVTGERQEAAEILEQALEWLQLYGYTRIVIDEGTSILPVLKRVAARVGGADYEGPLKREFLASLILETHNFSKSHKGVTSGFADGAKPVKLSKQQASMLTLLAMGYTNAMIVQETGLKLSTVKTHTAIAYQKLGVNNAADAVLKAREMGLI